MQFSGKNISFKRNSQTILQGINFTLNPGDCLILRGNNGSGKTTLLKMMAGLQKPTKGKIKWNGLNIRKDRMAHRKRHGYSGHRHAIKENMTVNENIEFWQKVSGRNFPDTDIFDLERLRPFSGRFLSEGQKKRCSLARVIYCGAPLWLFDEPLTALDSHATSEFIRHCEEHMQKGGMVVFSTHTNLHIDGATILELTT